MKATGIVRRIDQLGRIVLPIEARRERGIEPKDAVEIFVVDDSIILQRYVPGCVFCGEHEDLKPCKDKPVCRRCRTEIGVRSGHAAD